MQVHAENFRAQQHHTATAMCCRSSKLGFVRPHMEDPARHNVTLQSIKLYAALCCKSSKLVLTCSRTSRTAPTCQTQKCKTPICKSNKQVHAQTESACHIATPERFTPQTVVCCRNSKLVLLYPTTTRVSKPEVQYQSSMMQPMRLHADGAFQIWALTLKKHMPQL